MSYCNHINSSYQALWHSMAGCYIRTEWQLNVWPSPRYSSSQETRPAEVLAARCGRPGAEGGWPSARSQPSPSRVCPPEKPDAQRGLQHSLKWPRSLRNSCLATVNVVVTDSPPSPSKSHCHFLTAASGRPCCWQPCPLAAHRTLSRGAARVQTPAMLCRDSGLGGRVTWISGRTGPHLAHAWGRCTPRCGGCCALQARGCGGLCRRC
eukprot:359213-Chlamydomonas_euryale.AAC.4